MKKEIKCSYFEAVYLCRAYIPLAFLSMLPSIIFKPEDAITAVFAYGFNLLLFLAIFIYGVVRVKNKRLFNIPEKELLRFNSGIIEKRKVYFSKPCVKSAIIEKSILSWFFNSEKIILNTGSRTGDNGNITMFISRRLESLFISLFYGETGSFYTVYKANIFRVFLMALSSSNAFAGVVIFIPFLNKTEELFGQKYKELIRSSIDFSPYIQDIGVPPIAAAITGILIAGLIISVISVMFSYGFLEVKKSRENDSILVKRGVIQKNIFVASAQKIVAYQTKQSILMSLLKICTVNFFACGQHRENGNKRVIVPAVSKKRVEDFFKLNLEKSRYIETPPSFSLKAYLYFPAMWLTLVGVSCIVCFFLNFDISPFYPIIIFLFFIFFVYFVMRIVAHKKAFLYADKGKAIISFYKRMSFTKTLIPISKIQGIEITQSIFQRYRNLCNINVYVYSENKRCFKIKHLKLSSGMKFSKIINHTIGD
ncbi:MAG: PH domain-containing protein [Ruminococcus sp.]|nr:PH domain-containing protein [Ruminococcus sp.]